MNPSKSLAYKAWIDDLSTYPPKDFLKRFDQFFRLIEAENRIKVGQLDKQYYKEINSLINLSNKAVEEMLPLVDLVRQQLRLIGPLATNAPIEAREFEGIISGKVQVADRYRAQTLFHAIRISIESCTDMDKNQPFTSLLSERGGLRYVDFQKFCAIYPTYGVFATQLNSHDERDMKEPWGDYSYIKYRDDFFDSFMATEAGPGIKNRLLNRLKSLVLYLLTPDERVQRRQVAQAGIPKLFALSFNPISIKCDGKNKTSWVNTRGKTQTYAILKQVSDKFHRQLSSKSYAPEEIKLSYKEIEDYLSDSRNCNRPMRWKGIHSEKRRLDYLAKNIRSSVPLASEEMFVENKNNNFFLCFRPSA